MQLKTVTANDMLIDDLHGGSYQGYVICFDEEWY